MCMCKQELYDVSFSEPGEPRIRWVFGIRKQDMDRVDIALYERGRRDIRWTICNQDFPHRYDGLNVRGNSDLIFGKGVVKTPPERTWTSDNIPRGSGNGSSGPFNAPFSPAPDMISPGYNHRGLKIGGPYG